MQTAILCSLFLVQCSVLVSLVSGLRATDLRSLEDKYEHEQQLRSLVAEMLKEELDVLKEKIENKDLDNIRAKPDGEEIDINKPANKQDPMESRVSSLVAQVNDMARIFQTKTQGCDQPMIGRSTYIRWGRTTCPVTSGAELVYKGYSAGSSYKETGGGSNYVCLTDNPQWEYTQEERNVANRGIPLYTANIWGGEFQIHAGTWPFKGDNINGGIVIENDPPCAVCNTKGQVLMIPGTFRCPAGWRHEYNGYLIAEKSDHSRSSEFVCMDGHPEALHGGSNSIEGALFYYTAIKCGALPCPPYTQNREVTCVVCSQ